MTMNGLVWLLLPSSPSELSTAAVDQTVPSHLTATVCSWPCAIALTPPSDASTCLGVVWLPGLIWSGSFSPHCHIVPSERSASDSLPAAAICTTPLRPGTCTGVGLVVVVPLPSWPQALVPQAQTVPSDFNARAWKSPAATEVIPLRPGTCTGTRLGCSGG